ncbi:MAG: efflux RND transporter periplasmic adaptor subunit, partial [Deltaproteobacteria bacterium]|nr:efflux RND transporter periplasmic adaptor subunit [Deltaproteobacteria bacterium]
MQRIRHVITSLALLVASPGLVLVGGCKQGPTEQAAPRETPSVKLAAEDVAVARRGELQTGPRISGTLEASLRAVVRAETAGSVVAIGPELGETVKKGDLLARVEAKALGDVTTSARSGVTSAQA